MRKFLVFAVVALVAWNGYLTIRLFELQGLSGKIQTLQIVENKVVQFTTDVTEVVDRSLEKVVGISSYRQGVLFSSGSGAIYAFNNGVVSIITNNHVINNADSVQVIFANGRNFEGNVIGTDLFTDLAIITVEIDFTVIPFKFGDSSVSKVGEWVLAIGSPLGQEFQGSVTMGILSGKDRVIPVDLSGNGIPDWDMIVLQTDAAINPGNSGGPLINLAGELIGINSMKIILQTVEGMGFSIPVNELIPIIDQLEEFGEVIRPILGVSAVGISDMSLFQKNIYGIQLNQNTGLYITAVTPQGPASIAGIREGDIIIQFDGVNVQSFKQFRRLLYSKNVDDIIRIVVIRNNSQFTVNVRLQ